MRTKTEFMENGILENDTIFIAGGSGMVGSAILRRFKSDIKFKNLKILTPNRSQLDLKNKVIVKEWFAEYKPNIVIIAAAKVGGIYANSTYPYNFLMENLIIQNNLIETAFEFNVRRLLFLGSSCIYPKFALQPIKEEYLLGNALEKTNEYYALAKIAGLKLCEALRIQYGFDAISLMPTNLYGQGDNYHPENSHVVPGLILKFIKAIKNNEKKVTCWGTGKPLREFLYVDDLADACIFSLENWFPSKNGSPKDSLGNKLNWLNVGSKYEITISELSRKIASILNFEGKIYWDNSKPDGTPRKKLDTTNLEKLGWISKIDLEEGLQKTINFFYEGLNNNTLRI